MDYYNKYIKYKTKYLNLLQNGGGIKSAKVLFDSFINKLSQRDIFFRKEVSISSVFGSGRFQSLSFHKLI